MKKRTNKFLRALLFAAVIISVICLAGCGKDENQFDYGPHDKLEIDGYYLRVMNSVESEGKVYETNYLVCTDEEMTNVSGNMTARFDEDGGLAGYDAVITQKNGQRVISFNKSRESSSYSDSLYSADYSEIISTEWESISIKWDSMERFLSKGKVDYYANGFENNYTEEQYLTQNGVEYLSCRIERKRSEDGSLASETITNYDENGNVKQ